NPRAGRARYWWRFGEPIPAFREAVRGQQTYLATPMTAKHRFFSVLDQQVLPDQGLIAITLEDPFYLGVLSSSIHIAWALAAGGRLGVGNDPRCNNTLTVDSFPFPHPSEQSRASIR